jgi:acetyl-CoA C-acetyltransferase
MGAHVIKGLLTHTGIEPNMIDEVIMGQALTAACGQNPARQAALKAGLPESTLAFVVGKVCGSGLKSVHLAAQAIQCGDADIVIAGGQENMSAAPHALLAREGLRMGDGKLTDTMIVDGLWDVYNDYHMGVTAENVAQKYGISRQMQDEFAVASQQKAEAAQLAGKFRTEILPFDIPQKKGHLRFEADEFIKPGTTLATLSGLRPAFLPQGCVTAGNASGLNDGAAAVLMMSAERAAALGFTPLARIQACAAAGVSPTLMGIGPVPASRKCLSKAGWKAQDLDLMEINEAFAAQAMAVNKEMDWDTSKINVNGGSIAIGHPIGASGCRILVTLLHEMVRRNAKRGLASLCIGGGMGIALALARD